MEYPQIISLVPEGEHFDASAVNEGVWLSVGHINSIEGGITALQQAVATNKVDLDARTSELATASQNLSAANATITERDATIAAQATEIANLKAAAAKSPATTTTTEDPNEGTEVEESDITKEAKKLREMRDK